MKRITKPQRSTNPAAQQASIHDFFSKAKSLESTSSPKVVKYLLIPVATIGCGKTTTALTLSNVLTSCAHVQSDNVKSKRQKLVKNALLALTDSNAVIVDRNNHTSLQRSQLLSDIESFKSRYLGSKNVTFNKVCLNFIPGDVKDSELWRTTTQRVISRGDRHQSIKADDMGAKRLSMVMRGFVNKFEPIDLNKEPDSAFDLVIDLDAEGETSSLENAKKVVSTLQRHYPDFAEHVSEAEYQHAFSEALQYSP